MLNSKRWQPLKASLAALHSLHDSNGPRLDTQALRQSDIRSRETALPDPGSWTVLACSTQETTPRAHQPLRTARC